jgi:hypothetical protein
MALEIVTADSLFIKLLRVAPLITTTILYATITGISFQPH